MPTPSSPLNSLIDVDDSLLVVIDIQDYFLKKIPAEEADLLLNRAGWLIEVARALQVPILATAEEIERLGTLSPALFRMLPPGAQVFNKMAFGLAGVPEILKAVKDSGKKTAVLVGLETDVCVAQSAIGLLQEGFLVVVLADVTYSPGGAHAVGLARIDGAGALVTSLKGLYYEWIRTVEMSNTLAEGLLTRIGAPKGIIL